MSPMGKCLMGICRHGYMSHGYMSPNPQIDTLTIFSWFFVIFSVFFLAKKSYIKTHIFLEVLETQTLSPSLLPYLIPCVYQRLSFDDDLSA